MRNTTEIQTSQMKRFYGQIEIVAKDLGAILIFPHIKVDVVRNKQRSCVLIMGKNLQGIIPTTNIGVLRLYVKHVGQKSLAIVIKFT